MFTLKEADIYHDFSVLINSISNVQHLLKLLAVSHFTGGKIELE